MALFSTDDGLVENCTCPSGEAELAHQLAELGCNIEHIVYGSGPTGFALVRTFSAAGFDMSVIAASCISRGCAVATKNDRLDAVKRAPYFACGRLRPIATPTVEQEGYRATGRRPKRFDTDMQRRAQIGLNKGEAHHALKNALRIGWRGEICDRTTEGQNFRIAGLNLLTAIIIYWNTKRLGITAAQRKEAGLETPACLLTHISPLGRAHIILTGEYRWRTMQAENL